MLQILFFNICLKIREFLAQFHKSQADTCSCQRGEHIQVTDTLHTKATQANGDALGWRPTRDSHEVTTRQDGRNPHEGHPPKCHGNMGGPWYLDMLFPVAELAQC